MGRLLGIDYGKARIGLAVSDETKLVARPLGSLENCSTFFKALQRQIQPLLPIESIILGLPLLLSGKESPMSTEVRKFSERLQEALPFPVILWDERLTSAQADRSLRDAGLKRRERAKVEDTFAATLILQSYLDYKRISCIP